MTQRFAAEQKTVGRWGTLLCALVLAATVLPLYLISFYNHPYYDDFGFSAPSHSAWQQTGSVGAVLSAALESARTTRATWQGTYTGTLFSNIQPGIFSEKLYFIGSFFLLTAFLLCFFAFFAAAFGAAGLGLERRETTMLSCLTLSLTLQFMPDTGEAFYWFNGGIGNAFVYSVLALAAALLLRLCRARERGKAVGLTAALALCMVLLGGGSYGGGLIGLCCMALAMLWLFARKNPRRWTAAGLWLLFLACFLYSMSAPGNGVRAGVIGAHPSAVMAVVQALYYGVALMGAYLRLPLFGLTALLLPCFIRGARRSALRFDHPWLMLLLLGGLFCVQLVPPLYGGVFIGGGRIVNTYWISFVVLWLLYAFYLTGFAVKRGKRCSPAEGKEPLAPPLRRGLALLGCCLVLVGSLGYKKADDPLYGVQNLAGVSAAMSLLNGEAAQYDREMSAREALLNDASLPAVTLAPLTVTPAVFMDDLLTPGALYDVRPALMLYYGKTAIAVQGEGAARE